jgi:hypothetical protein
MSESPRRGKPEKTPKGYEIPVRTRQAVLADFRKIVAPKKDRDRQKKP